MNDTLSVLGKRLRAQINTTARRNRTRTVVTTDTYAKRNEPTDESLNKVGRTIVNIKQVYGDDDSDNDPDRIPKSAWFERFSFFNNIIQPDINEHTRQINSVDDTLEQVLNESSSIKPMLLHREVSSVSNFIKKSKDKKTNVVAT